MKKFFQTLIARLSGNDTPAPLKESEIAPTTVKEIVVKEYRVEIFNGAGMVKINASGTSEKEAKEKAIQKYLKTLTIKTRPI